MKTKGTKSRRLRAIPNNRKLREDALFNKYRTKSKKVKVSKRIKVSNRKLKELALKRLGL